jgi:hypothetical protein
MRDPCLFFLQIYKKTFGSQTTGSNGHLFCEMLGEYGLTEIHLRPQFIHIFGKLHYQSMVVILFIKEFWQEITFAIIPFWPCHIKSYPEFNLLYNQSYLSHILCVTANKKRGIDFTHLHPSLPLLKLPLRCKSTSPPTPLLKERGVTPCCTMISPSP